MRTVWLLLFCLITTAAFSQEHNPCHWHSMARQSYDKKAPWLFSWYVSIDSGWHIYSLKTSKDGPPPPKFIFEPAAGLELYGEPQEESMIDPFVYFDSTYMVDVYTWENSISFRQKAKVKGKGVVQGRIEYVACSEERCIPFTLRFKLPFVE